MANFPPPDLSPISKAGPEGTHVNEHGFFDASPHMKISREKSFAGRRQSVHECVRDMEIFDHDSAAKFAQSMHAGRMRVPAGGTASAHVGQGGWGQVEGGGGKPRSGACSLM